MVSGKPATIHHVKKCGGRRDDHRILPLAPEYHLIQHGPRTAIEAIGKRAFELRHGVDIEAKVLEYRTRYLGRLGQSVK